MGSSQKTERTDSTMAPAKKKGRLSGLPAATDTKLRGVYTAFCSFGKGDESKVMDGKTFTKALKDSKVITKKSGVTATDSDLVFAKIVPQGKRKIGYLAFVKAIAEIAKRGK